MSTHRSFNNKYIHLNTNSGCNLNVQEYNLVCVAWIKVTLDMHSPQLFLLHKLHCDLRKGALAPAARLLHDASCEVWLTGHFYAEVMALSWENQLYSVVNLHSFGKSPSLIGTSTRNGQFSIAMLNCQNDDTLTSSDGQVMSRQWVEHWCFCWGVSSMRVFKLEI